MADLPDCDELFMKFFDRYYDDDDRKAKGFSATRPDLLNFDEPIEENCETLSRLSEDWKSKVKSMIETMYESAKGDFQRYLPIKLPVSLGWIDAFDKYWDQERVSKVIQESDPEDFSNDLVVLCCEFGATLGSVLIELQPRLQWIYDWPYWESSLFDPTSGTIIAVFHWAIKKFSSYGIDDGFEAKVICCLQVLDQKKRRSKRK